MPNSKIFAAGKSLRNSATTAEMCIRDRYKVDVDAVLLKGEKDKDMVLKPGDVIFVDVRIGGAQRDNFLVGRDRVLRAVVPHQRIPIVRPRLDILSLIHI